jgi:hypothetical protein
MLTCAVLAFPVYRDVLAHEYDLFRYSQEFRNLDHPAGTSSVAYKAFVGHITGNGNPCNYFVGNLRRYTGERQAIEAFYANQDYAGLGGGLAFIENGEFKLTDLEWLPPGLKTLSAWLDPPGDARASLYLVFSFHLDLDSGLDFRCS